jgi:hypothetical protein
MGRQIEFVPGEGIIQTAVTNANGGTITTKLDTDFIASIIPEGGADSGLGITDWSIRPNTEEVLDVCFGDGKFVAVGTNATYTSPDGDTWVKTATTQTGNWNYITYGNGKYIATAYDIFKYMYSTDGVSWTVANTPSSALFYSIHYGNGKFVAMAGDALYSSSDGISWTSSTIPEIPYPQNVTFLNGYFIVGGFDVNFGIPSSKYSTDLTTWSDLTCVIDSGLYNAYGVPNDAVPELIINSGYINGKYWMLAYISNADSSYGMFIGVSTNGISWTFYTTPFDDVGYIIQGDGQLIAAIPDNILIASDPLGAVESVPVATYGYGARGAYGNGRYVIIIQDVGILASKTQATLLAPSANTWRKIQGSTGISSPGTWAYFYSVGTTSYAGIKVIDANGISFIGASNAVGIAWKIY